MRLPHTRTARLLDTVIRADASSIEATGRIPAGHPLVRNGRAPALIGIELGAQAAAAMQHADGPSTTAEPRRGHLARIREAAFLMPDLPAERELRVIAELEGAAPPLAIYRIRVVADGVEALNATISTHQS